MDDKKLEAVEGFKTWHEFDAATKTLSVYVNTLPPEAIRTPIAVARTASECQAELDTANRECGALLNSIWHTDFADIAPEWKPLGDLVGKITQLDNMVAGLMARNRMPMELPWSEETPASEDGWRTMESAPKNDTEIVLVDKYARASDVVHWRPPFVNYGMQIPGRFVNREGRGMDTRDYADWVFWTLAPALPATEKPPK